MKLVSYGRHTIGREEIRAVVNVLKGDWLSQGPHIAEFEKRVADYCGARYAVAVSNGTAALHLAMRVAGLGPTKNAITTPLTFIATANAMLHAGGRPLFCDVRSSDLNIDDSRISTLVNRDTAALVPVHFAGASCRMDEIAQIARGSRLRVIEDACHALGGSYRNTKIGSCRYSDMSVFSFHPVKSITTGEGGMITTNSREFYEQLQDLRNHGTRRGERRKLFREPWEYEMYDLGFNYRITDIQCALGIEQMKKLDQFIAARKRLARFYLDALSDYEHWDIPQKDFLETSAWHLFVVKFLGKNAERKRQLAYDEFLRQRIQTQVHYTPVYRHPYYQGLGYTKKACPRTEDAYARILSIPLYPSLKLKDAKRVVGVFKKLPNLFKGNGF